MTSLFSAVLLHVLSVAAVLQLYFGLPSQQRDAPYWLFGTAVIVTILVIAIIWELVNYWHHAPTRIRLSNKRKITKYMEKWIRSGGRTVIFTRDMSWGNDPAVRRLLEEKARRNELTICLEHQINLADELEAAGARIIRYGELGHIPRSRYTIIDFERGGARVAVGGPVGKYHVIQEFRDGEHPFFAVADDLAKILIAFGERA